MKKAEPDTQIYNKNPFTIPQKRVSPNENTKKLYIFVNFYVFSLLETYLMEIEFQSHHFNFLELI